MKRKKRK